MPPLIQDHELIEEMRDGAKIADRKPMPGQAPKGPSEMQQILEAIRNLDKSLMALAERPAPPVNVSSPSIHVKSPVHVDAPKVWRKFRVKVTERDDTSERRLKELEIEGIE